MDQKETIFRHLHAHFMDCPIFLWFSIVEIVKLVVNFP